MLDQFEEFFLYHEQTIAAFVEELADVIRRPDLRVNVLIGIAKTRSPCSTRFKA